MNIEAILREREELQKKQHDPARGKIYPYVLSQDSLEKFMAQHPPPAATLQTESDMKLLQSSMSIDAAEEENNASSMKTAKSSSGEERKNFAAKNHHSFDDVITGATSQHTSVITSVRQRSTDKTRLKSFQRQKSVDETMHNDVTENATTTNKTKTETMKIPDNNNNMTDKMQRNVTEHSIAYFLDDTHANRDNKGNILKSSSVQESGYGRGERYADMPPTPAKSKSLDLVEGGEADYPYLYPGRYPKYSSSLNFEMEEQSARYINALHISPPASHLYGHSSFPNSPCGSPIDAALRHSPVSVAASPLRRLQQNDRHLATETGPSNGIPQQQIPTLFSNARARGSEQFVKSRSYDQQQVQRQHKFSKKAYSLATAPYDVHEKNLRRILSEDNVPENLILSKQLGKYQQMRRAASYDLINRSSSPSSGNSPTRPTTDAGAYLRQQAVVKSTKIMFPEHDNVTDCNNIFTQPVDDERAHALKINKILERSFNSAGDPAQHPLHTTHNTSYEEQQTQHDILNKERAYAMSKDLQNALYQTKHAQQTAHMEEIEKTNKKMDGAPKPTKLLVHQGSNDKNFAIGPYQYNAEIDDEIAVSVSGLLTLPGSNEKKYPISVGEMRRRIAPPEFLNKVDMISYVRLAKTSARELLEKHAIRPKHHSRKSKHSVISKMCEAECAELANGVKMLSELYFPKEWLAKQGVDDVTQEEEDSLKKRRELTDMYERYEIAKGVMKEISALIETKKPSEEMQNYNLATHSFGAVNLNNNIELLTSFMQTQTDVINQRLVNIEYLSSRDDNSMETESGISSKSSSIDDPHM